jgi:hypothetical protein
MANPNKYGTKYMVGDEHTLLYKQEGMTYQVGILAGSVLRGGMNPMQGWTVESMFSVMREATLEDFEFFRVSPKGHIA